MIFDIFVSHDDVMEIEYFTYVLHEFSLSLKLVGMTADICTVKNKFKPKKQVKKLVVILYLFFGLFFQACSMAEPIWRNCR